MSAKILLAAFKSLGAKEENASEQIWRVLLAERADKADYVVLDNGPSSEGQLEHALSSGAGGILLTQEDGSLKWRHFYIEDCAFNLQDSLQSNEEVLGRARDAVQMPYLEKISSEFSPEARTVVGETGALKFFSDLGATERAGDFWCNRTHYRALEWGQARKRLVLLVRVGVSGTEQSKLIPLCRILDLMIEKTSHERRA